MEASKQVRAAVGRRNRLAARLGGMLIVLVILFDLCSVLLPQVAGLPVAPGVVISIGVVSAFVVIGAVIVSAAFYVHCLNQEDADPKLSAGARSD